MARPSAWAKELAVARAYAMEAGVALCCLLDSGDGGKGRDGADVLSRLMGWQDR